MKFKYVSCYLRFRWSSGPACVSPVSVFVQRYSGGGFASAWHLSVVPITYSPPRGKGDMSSHVGGSDGQNKPKYQS